jgi:PIN domain nuclease of toxin-antitoxin system
MLPVSAQHALRLFSLPVHHKDPFDRIIVAQSQEEDIAIITADAVMRRYEIEVIW